MQLALRPYVTTGVAIVGASVIAVAPIVPTPTEVQIPNPLVQVDRPVELTANEIENAFNQLTFVGAQLVTTLAKLPAPLVAQLLGIPEQEAQALLALGSLGLVGSALSTTGATGTALQDIVDQLGSFDLAGLVNALIGAPATLIDGLVNGGYGADLTPLIAGLLSPMAAAAAPILPILPGGLIRGDFPLSLVLDPPRLVLVGLFPTLQFLVSQITDRLGLGGGTMVSTLVAPVETEGQIEGAVNLLLFNLLASPIVTVAGFVGSLLAPVLGEEQAALLPVAALGLLGPLISGPGAIGTALQDVVDELGSGDIGGLINALIGAPATVIDGLVNGGYGPSLTPLVGPILFPGVPIGFLPKFLAGGLVNGEDLLPPIVLPGVFPTLQRLVGQILGLVGLAAPEALTAETTAEEMSINSVDTSNQRLVTLDLNDGGSTPDTGGQVSGTNAGTQPDNNQQGATGGGQAGNDGQQQGSTQGSGQTGGTTTPTTPGTSNGATDMTDGSKFEPEIKADDTEGNNENGSNTTGATTTTGTEVSGHAVENTPDEESNDGGGEE
jgi:hypothetical protein